MQKILAITLVLCLWSSLHAIAQKIDLVLKNASLETAIEEFKQRGFDVYADSSVSKSKIPVSITAVNQDIETVLLRIFSQQPFSHRLQKDVIHLSYKVSWPTAGPVVAPKVKSLSGVVRSTSGELLTGATIQLKNEKGKGANTSQDGSFILPNAPVNGTLSVTFVGFVPKEVNYSKQSVFNIALVPQELLLKEQTVPKGNYIVPKFLNTGAVSGVSAADIANQPVSDVLLALPGRVSGLSVVQNSGFQGASPTVTIRGLNSMANGNAPLYIVDGVPFGTPFFSSTFYAPVPISPFTVIRPEDIESITVLKDADATAIYGSRGANGVILITTRKAGIGRTKVDVDLSRGFNEITRKMKLMNTSEYLGMRSEALKNDNVRWRSDDHDINGTWDRNRQNDWQEELFGTSALLTNAQARLSAGNENTRFWIAGKYREEKSITKPGEFFGRTRSVGGSIFHLSDNKRFEMRIGADYSYIKYKSPQTDYYKNVYMAANAPSALKPDGTLDWDSFRNFNPAADAFRTSEITLDNLMSYFQSKFKIFSGFYVLNNFGYTATKYRETAITPGSSFGPGFSNVELLRTKKTASNEIMTWLYEPQVCYKTVFKHKHTLDIIAGATFQESINNKTRLDAIGFGADGMIMNFEAAENLTGRQGNSKYSYNAMFARLGYNYNDRYVLNLTGRRDGSSRLDPKKRFGNFGAIGAAWIFTEEELLKKALPFLYIGKLKASYGVTGNDQIQDYLYMNRYTVGIGMGGSPGLTPVQLTNENFGWEVIKKKQLGVELDFRNHMYIEASYYHHQTTQQLVATAASAVTGYNSIIKNIPAKVANKGFEFDLHSENVRSKNFTWQTNFNITFPKNKLVSFPNFDESSFIFQYAVGQPLNIRYMYDYDKVDPETGLYTFRQHQEDNVLNQYDKVPTFIGQKYFGGLSNAFTYKGIAVDVFFQFVKQTGYLFGGLTAPGSNFESGANQPALFLDRWQMPGDIAEHQKFSTSDKAKMSYDQYQESNAVIKDASFIRLKNISVSFTVPKATLNKLNIQTLKFYIQGQNLLLITPFKGSDPETVRPMQAPALPPLRTIVGGLHVTF